MTRTTKTAAERAQETVDIAKRRVERLNERWTAAEAAVAMYRRELGEAQAALDYAQANPALKDGIPTS